MPSKDDPAQLDPGSSELPHGPVDAASSRDPTTESPQLAIPSSPVLPPNIATPGSVHTPERSDSCENNLVTDTDTPVHPCTIWSPPPLSVEVREILHRACGCAECQDHARLHGPVQRRNAICEGMNGSSPVPRARLAHIPANEIFDIQHAGSLAAKEGRSSVIQTEIGKAPSFASQTEEDHANISDEGHWMSQGHYQSEIVPEPKGINPSPKASEPATSYATASANSRAKRKYEGQLDAELARAIKADLDRAISEASKLTLDDLINNLSTHDLAVTKLYMPDPTCPCELDRWFRKRQSELMCCCLCHLGEDGETGPSWRNRSNAHDCDIYVEWIARRAKYDHSKPCYCQPVPKENNVRAHDEDDEDSSDNYSSTGENENEHDEDDEDEDDSDDSGVSFGPTRRPQPRPSARQMWREWLEDWRRGERTFTDIQDAYLHFQRARGIVTRFPSRIRLSDNHLPIFHFRQEQDASASVSDASHRIDPTMTQAQTSLPAVKARDDDEFSKKSQQFANEDDDRVITECYGTSSDHDAADGSVTDHNSEPSSDSEDSESYLANITDKTQPANPPAWSKSLPRRMAKFIFAQPVSLFEVVLSAVNAFNKVIVNSEFRLCKYLISRRQNHQPAVQDAIKAVALAQATTRRDSSIVSDIEDEESDTADVSGIDAIQTADDFGELTAAEKLLLFFLTLEVYMAVTFFIIAILDTMLMTIEKGGVLLANTYW